MTKYPSEIETVRAFLAAARADDSDEPTFQEMRIGYEAAGSNMPVAEGVAVEDVTLGGVSGLKLTPDTVEAGRTLLYFHGGGYVIGSPISHRGMVSHIAKAMRATAYSMDYRMAPEDRFPAAVDDGLTSYKALLEGGVDPQKLVISGDSAGGGLTMATALSIRDAGLAMPAALVPISPWVNLANNGPTYKVKAETDPMVTKESIDAMAAEYLNGEDASNPLASPMGADLAGLPPMLIQVGSEEVLLSDSTMLAARAGAAKVPVTLEIWPDMVHVFHFFYPMLSDARTAIAHMATWVDEKLA
ncbi:MAG: alpha/beta hydrolase [Hyphomonadaceae bacterium]